jgi:hypothetical protein
VYREPVRVDYVTEAPDVSGDDALFDLFLAVFTSLFKSKSRLEVLPVRRNTAKPNIPTPTKCPRSTFAR